MAVTARSRSLDHDLLAGVSRLRFAIGRLERQFRQNVVTPLTATQLSVLGSIHGHGPLSMSELGAYENLSAPSISKVVVSLEEQGLIERLRDDADRRVCLVQVTDEGQRWVQARRAERNAWFAERFATLDSDEQSALLAALPVLERIADVGV